MALDKNDGIFSPSIEGVISGKTSQVTGMNGLLNDLIGNDNYLKDKKLDRGNYVGSGELLSKDDNAIWGGEYGGKIQDPIPKELNKRYIDNINGKAFICIKAGDSSVTSNTIEYFTPCNVADNLAKLQNLYNVRDLNIIDLDSKTLLVSANVSVVNGELRDLRSSYGFCQKYLAFNISNIIPIPKSVHLLGCFCGVRDKTQLDWVSGTSSTFSYKNGVIHLYLTNPTDQYNWTDQSVSFSLIAKY